MNSASLVEAAAHLYAVGHDQGCLVLAVSAREELGRFALLASRAKKMAPGEHVSPKQLRKALDDHEEKLRAGQTSVVVPISESLLKQWREAIAENDAETLRALEPQVDLVAKAIRKREPRETHLRRMRAQYADPNSDGSWSDPASVSIEDARVAFMSVTAGVANTLLGLQSNNAFSKARSEFGLPDFGQFTTKALSQVAARGA
jgi:AbiV family abortive infection protein